MSPLTKLATSGQGQGWRLAVYGAETARRSELMDSPASANAAGACNASEPTKWLTAIKSRSLCQLWQLLVSSISSFNSLTWQETIQLPFIYF